MFGYFPVIDNPGCSKQPDNNIKQKPRKKCRRCQKTFSSHYLLQEHISTNHLNSFPCKVCKKDFKKFHQLRQHMLTNHPGTRNYCCNICNKLFVYNSALNKHLKLHHLNAVPVESESEKLVCTLCERRFMYQSTLNRHFNDIHLGIKRHISCQICGEKFCDFGLLKKHTRIRHSTNKEKTYKCCLCTVNSFPEAGPLKTHLRTHITKNPPFNCGLCKATFNGRNKLLDHIYKHCKEDYKCEICSGNVFFSSIQKLECHNELCHKKQVVATENSSEIEDLDPFKCCGLEFRSSCQFEKHKRHHGNLDLPNGNTPTSTTTPNMESEPGLVTQTEHNVSFTLTKQEQNPEQTILKVNLVELDRPTVLVKKEIIEENPTCNELVQNEFETQDDIGHDTEQDDQKTVILKVNLVELDNGLPPQK